MEKILHQILAKFDNFESDVKELKHLVTGLTTVVTGHDKSIKELTTVVNEVLKPKVDESHKWIRTLIENKDFQKAEMDKLQHKVAVVEGVLHGFADSLEPVKKAQ